MGDTSTNTTSSRRRLPGKKSPQNDGYKEGKNKGKAHRDYSNAEQARKRNPGKHDRWANKYDVDGGDFRVYGKGKGRRRLPIQDADTPTNTLNAVHSDTASPRRSLMFRQPKSEASRNQAQGDKYMNYAGSGAAGRIDSYDLNATYGPVTNANHQARTDQYTGGNPNFVRARKGWQCRVMRTEGPCQMQNTGRNCGRYGCIGTEANPTGYR